MKSALVFRPLAPSRKGRGWKKTDIRNYQIRYRMGDLLFWCQRLAEASNEKVSVLIQHNFKKDLLAVSVERKTKTIAGYSDDPLKVLRNVFRRVRKEAKEREDASWKKAKRAARKRSRRKHRR